MKKLKWIVIGLAVGGLLCLALVWMNLNAVVKAGVERASTQSLGLATTLDSASVSLFGGSLGLDDLKVASPAGFEAQHFVELGGLRMEVALSELRQTPIRVGRVTVSKPKLVLEQKDLKLNLKEVMDTLPKSDPNAGPPPKLVIGEVMVDGATVVLRPGLPGLANEIVVALPDLVVRDIGTADERQNGIAIKGAMLAVATAMAEKAMESEKIPPELRVLLKGDLSGLKARVGEEVEKLQAEVKERVQRETEKAAEDVRKKAEKGLGGLGDLLKKP